MASRFERRINLLRFQMICSTEKLGLLCKWSLFRKVDDPELKAFLKVCDNLEKAAALLLPSDSNDSSSNEDLAAELHVESIGLKESFTLVNEMKAQFEDLEAKLDLIVTWINSKTLAEKELKEFLNLVCQYETIATSVPVLLTEQIISKYVQEFNELKSKMELLKTELNFICECIVYMKAEDFERLEVFCNQQKSAVPATATTISSELVNDHGSIVGQSDAESESEPMQDLYKTKSTATPKSPKSKKMQCEVCYKKFIFKYPSLLKKHLLVHWGQKKHSCDICEKKFARVKDLKDHKQRHSTVKSYPCDTCTKSFATSGDRKKHQKIHTGEKNFSCNVCRKRFARSHHLKIHKRIHTKEKPYNCIQCGTKFARQHNLKSHRLTHTGEKPHNCIFCGKNFRERNTLIDHLRIHTGEKSLGCPHCNQQFRTKSNLRSHRKKYHSQQ